MIINIFRFLFLFFLYFSNSSIILTIYPILYYLIKNTEGTINWYYYGLALSLYEIGKILSIPIWKRLSSKKSNILLILVSLFLISLLNISFCFISELIHIFIIRFLLGICNHIGSYFKDIYIQMGFKKNNKNIIFLISITCTGISLFLPSISIYYNLGEKKLSINNIRFKNIMLIYMCLASSNILSIIFCIFLIFKNKVKIKLGFYEMNNLEKAENTQEGPIKQKSKIVEIDQKSNSKIIKSTNNQISDTNINIINNNKLSNDTDTGLNKNEKSLDNNISIYNVNHKNEKLFIQSKETQFCFIQILISLSDSLTLIWTLIILYVEFCEKCLTISIYLSILKVLGEIILFPINKSFTKYSTTSLITTLDSIIFKMRIISIFLLIISLCISQFIFSIYYFSKYKDILKIILFSFLLIRTVLSGLFTQLYKIYVEKYFRTNQIKIKNLKIYYQYFGGLSKICIYIIGSFGLLMIEIIINGANKLEIFSSIIYFHLIPQIIYVNLLISCFKFI